MKQLHKSIGIISCALLLSITATLAITAPTKAYPFQAEVMDSLHFPSAILLMYFLTLILDKPNTRYLRVILALAAIITLEIIQPFFGRSAQWQDILHGILGVTLFLLWHHLSPLWRTLTIMLFVSISSQNLFNAVLYRYQLQHGLPSIMIKGFTNSPYGWRAIATSHAEQTIVNGTQLQWSVLLQNDKWQGVQWHNPWLDLSKIRELCFTARASDEVSLSIRIDDNQSTNYYSRYNSVVALSQGWQTYCIDMTTLHDMHRRQLDKSKLHYVYFFSKADASGAAISWFTLANVKMIN